MSYYEGFQKVLEYVEQHLEGEPDYQAMADMMGYSTYHFHRLFLLMTGVSSAEYIRNRKLAKAAAELLDGENRVLDVALKYGYNSPTAFNRAFKNMHGVAPSEMKKSGVTVKAFPAVHLQPVIKSARKMEYRIERMDAFRIVGKKLTTTMEGGECYQKAPQFWGEMIQQRAIPQILGLMNSQPMGLLGVSNYDPEAESSAFDYYIAVSSDQSVPEGMSESSVPAAVWAIFSHKNESPEVIQDFQKRIVLEWLPSSGYEFAKGPDVELYYEDDRMETWIPITRRNGG